MVSRRLVTCGFFLATLLPARADAQLGPYNPYADAQEQPAPLAPDGTIQWGTFYKSAKVQKDYERLWAIGACRGTARDVTARVVENRLVIDRLPGGDFAGVVCGAAGTVGGGVIAFGDLGGGGATSQPLVAQFHPAGVTRFAVTGRAAAADVIQPGLTVRVHTRVDEHGRAAEPVRAIDVISPPTTARPPEVAAGRDALAIGTVAQVRRHVVTVRLPAGHIRTLSLTLADDAVATIEAADLSLVAPGDRIEVKGRLWTGEGSMGAGTVFADDVTVRKPELPAPPPRRADAAQPIAR